MRKFKASAAWAAALAILSAGQVGAATASAKVKVTYFLPPRAQVAPAAAGADARLLGEAQTHAVGPSSPSSAGQVSSRDADLLRAGGPEGGAVRYSGNVPDGAEDRASHVYTFTWPD